MVGGQVEAGVCKEPIKQGESCTVELTKCEDGFSCVRDCQIQRRGCSKEAFPSGVCRKTTAEPSQLQTWANSSVINTEQKPDAPCLKSEDCESPLVCFGYYKVGTRVEAGVCKEPIKQGESCTVGRTKCEDGFSCVRDCQIQRRGCTKEAFPRGVCRETTAEPSRGRQPK
jgi:hypothetical protein